MHLLRKISFLLAASLILTGCASASNDRANARDELAADTGLADLQEEIAPNMVGLSMFDAQRVGEAIGAWPDPQDWSPKTRDDGWEDWAKSHFVCWQGPAVGEEVSNIEVAVSTDCSDFWIVPDLVNLSAPDAIQTVRARGFSLELEGIGNVGAFEADDPRVICEQELEPNLYLPREMDTWGNLRSKQKIVALASEDCELLFAEREEAAELAAEEEAQRQAKKDEEAALKAQIDDPNTPLGTRAFINGSRDGLEDLYDQVQYIKDTALAGDLCLFICWLNIPLAKNLVVREIAPDSHASQWESLKQQLEVDVEAMNTARDYFWEDILNSDELIAEIDKVLSTVRKMQTLVKGIPYPDL